MKGMSKHYFFNKYSLFPKIFIFDVPFEFQFYVTQPLHVSLRLTYLHFKCTLNRRTSHFIFTPFCIPVTYNISVQRHVCLSSIVCQGIWHVQNQKVYMSNEIYPLFQNMQFAFSYIIFSRFIRKCKEKFHLITGF